jgi:hypothetical protein
MSSEYCSYTGSAGEVLLPDAELTIHSAISTVHVSFLLLLLVIMSEWVSEWVSEWGASSQ